LEIEKTVVEGSGATGIAAMSAGKLDFRGQKVAFVLTGGNIDMTALGRIIEKGLVKDGRLARIRVVVEDIPGELAKLTTVIAKTRANIREIVHERAFMPTNLGMHHTSNILTLETKGPQHIELIMKTLADHGYRFVEYQVNH
jgi:threonine dehydratase